MRKFGVITSLIFIVIIIAGIYGILHDQITYSISPEYFTKFKYKQFGFESEQFGGHRATVAVIGFLATWWMGLFIGIPLGLLSLIFPDYKKMASVLKKSLFLVILIAVLTGIGGFVYGKFILVNNGVSWWLPDDLIDKSSFIIVGSIHNSSYLGGIAGLLTATVYMFMQKRRNNNTG
ncbi:hypothetical protein ESA94_13965 [Lacibacter luteus]|uniref:Signal peptide-containing protein n=1 Tax=Lacibacter luteus TaxID=2508719 RepID=A0A4Q1CGR5_9BACT|nr:hypothetical protein [Lacibacter luteus]RXK59243.1 hypothetical protein ESA94_13965 [Lacibacter luteus]